MSAKSPPAKPPKPKIAAPRIASAKLAVKPSSRAKPSANGHARTAKPKAPPAPPHVFLALPNYGSIHPATLAAVSTCSKSIRLTLHPETASLLAYCFNRCYAIAHNNRSEGVTHFAMLHSDMAPDPLWLDMLMSEMQRTGADIVSAVVPLKDSRGLTSTGVMDRETGVVRRLTMRELFSLPETFNLDHCLQSSELNVRSQHNCLAINTGCFLWDLSKPVNKKFPGFNILDKVFEGDDGKLAVAVLSEDWNWGRWATDAGLSIYATRAVKLTHYGMANFRNDYIWGSLEGADPGDI